jgi:hypothetical protein
MTVDSKFLPVLVFTLGTASLKNYAKLIREWFGVSLNDYNFFILPIGFSYPFGSLSLADIRKEPGEVADILQAVADDQMRNLDGDGFFLVCELQTRLVSAKKITEASDLIASVDPSDPTASVINPVKLTDRYPYTYLEVFRRVKGEVPTCKQGELNRIIKYNQIKGNNTYSAYNYRSRSHEIAGPKNTTQVLYNENFVQFCITLLQSPSAS